VTPVGLLEHLVDKQHSPTPLLEFTGKVGYATSLEIEIVQVDVEARTVGAVLLLGVL